MQNRLTLYVLICVCVCCHGITGATMLPYGPSHPDDVMVLLEDDVAVEVATLAPFQFYEVEYTSIWVTDNGYFGFENNSDCCGVGFPEYFPMIAPLWEDWVPGMFYYRQTTSDPADLQAASTFVRNLFPPFGTFQATWAMVATWSNFDHFITDAIESATFQAVLTTDGTFSFAVFLYENIDYRTYGTVGINAGDDENHSILCIFDTDEILDLPVLKQHCSGEEGVFGFRMDSYNPDQDDYICTESFSEAVCAAGQYCVWSDASQTSVDVIFNTDLPGIVGVMAWDTQKYEDGENPNLSDKTCRTEYTGAPTSLSFTIDLTATVPACGVRMTGDQVKTIEVTIRVYTDDERLDVANDSIYQFTCSTDSVLPTLLTQSHHFNAADLVTELAIPSRKLELQVIESDSAEKLSEVHVGQLVRLRVVYDNTANQLEPYGVYIKSCWVADTVNFDTNTVNLIENGCVVQQGKDAVWYISRSFQQTSLSPSGIFIADSGTIEAVRFVNKDKLTFRCLVDFCFFATAVSDLCTDSCPISDRRKRNEKNTASKSKPQVLHTTVDVLGSSAMNIGRESNSTREQKGCLDERNKMIALAILGMLIALSFIYVSVVFCKIIHLQRKMVIYKSTS